MSTPILHILEERLIRWIEKDGLEQFFVARQRLKELEANPHFTLIPEKMKGPRKAVRSFAFMQTTALWPNDRLLETPTPLLSFVLEGQADFHIGDYWLQDKAGQGIFTLSDVPRKDGSEPNLHPNNRKKGAYTIVNFSETRGRLQIWFNQHGTMLGEQEKHLRVFTLDDRALQLLDQLQHQFARGEQADRILCLSLLKSFLHTLRADFKEGRYIQAGILRDAKILPQADYEPISRAQHYINTHLHETLTLQKVARLVRMSRTQFAISFRNQTGKTFNQYVTQHRMEQAKALLKETNYTLTFVANSVGYSSLTYFHKVFKKHFDISAQEFRQRQFSKITNDSDNR
jgi:AraC-like DNA-binding protein